MRRWQLFELEDQAWCPRVIRDGITDVLAFSFRHGNPYVAAIPWIQQTLRACGSQHIVDLASGGGGPWPSLLPQLNAIREAPVTVCLTDRYPNFAALDSAAVQSEGGLTVHRDAVDAAAVPKELAGILTLFTTFHHFSPQQAAAVLQNAVSQRRGICIFEITHRSWRGLLMTLLSPLLVWLVTPSLRPFRWSKFLLTYLIPAIPAAVLFDGIVSCLRTYRPEELLDLVPAESFADYEWFAGELPRGASTPITYLVGYPKNAET